MSHLAVHVSELSKLYRIGGPQERYPTLRETLNAAVMTPLRRVASVLRGGSAHLTNRTVWALREVSFDVPQGQVVGIIGRNGAGKSTLLKVLSRITDPTSGLADIYGRVGSLLEVGTGFHPELTGRENIFLNGAILGMRRAEIEGKLDEIVAFAEIERFLDTPVKHYSSGMYLRLAFSVAAHLEPEILLVDEVLAVGDAAFQKKCLGKMNDVAREGRTVLFVSHNMEAVQRLCQRCLWIDEGRLRGDGEAAQVVVDYLHQWHVDVRPRYVSPSGDTPPPGDRAVLLEAEIVGADGRSRDSVRFGEPFGIRMVWEHLPSAPGAGYYLRVFDSQDRFLFAANTVGSSVDVPTEGGRRELVCRFPHNVLVPGDYSVTIGCSHPPKTVLHAAERCLALPVLSVPFDIAHAFKSSGLPPLVALRPNWGSNDD